MDAQNAAEAVSTKPAASSKPPSMSSSSRPAPDSDRPKPSSSSLTKSPVLPRLPPPSKDAKTLSAKAKSPPPSSVPAQPKESPKGLAAGSAPSSSPKNAKSTTSSRDKQDDDGGGTDGNSEAETIVLSKDGSPSKPRNRKVIKHEDTRNGDSGSPSSTHVDQTTNSRKHATDKKDGPSEKERTSGTASVKDGGAPSSGSVTAAATLQKKRRPQERQQQSHLATKDTSSSLSSAPASPPRSRQHSTNPASGSDSDRARATKSPRPQLSSKDKLRPSEKLVPHKRKAPKADSDDEGASRKARRQRPSGEGAAHSSGKTGKDQPHHGNHSKSSSSRPHAESSQNRSLSPQPRSHRRSLSTQISSSQSNGLGMKKKRVPTPLQSTEYHSDDSSASGSPRMRNSKLRGLSTPATGEPGASPIKIGPHKKHLDAHGQTFLARACARGEYVLAKKRLAERPDDLNVADFAGNTPLQIAALNGYGEIVKLLIEAGCNLDCVNHDKETPLLDAVDNGHLEVVKLLLDAGVNPRKANVNGEEPLDRVTDDIENAAEIRTALIEAKKKIGGRRLTSEEHRHENDELRFLQGPDSPRRSPAPPGQHSSGRRSGTVRATKTSNHLLYMPMDDKTLRAAAGRGDEETVTRILQVREIFDDPESMVAAARGGHDIVMQLLLALGGANPDPPPVSSVPPEHATPMLAAIGQENLNVVRLLLDQSSFNPTQRFRGNTYYEIARQRTGPNWKEEEDLLKNAYDSYRKTHGKDGKTKSPPRKDAESRKAGRSDAREEPPSRAHKRKVSSPSRERTKKTTARDEKSAQKRSDHSAAHGDGRASPKRTGPASLASSKHKRDDRSSVISGPDRDTPPPSKQVAKSRKADSDSVAVSSEGETVKPRRKLISGKELKDEKEKQRRASLASANAAAAKDISSPRDSRHDDIISDKVRAEKHRDRDRDRARQLKKEESKESASGSAEGSGKRHRMSETPPRLGSSEKDASEAPIKRRRLDGENSTSSAGKERKTSKVGASSDGVLGKSAARSSSRDAHVTSKLTQKRRDEEDRKAVSASLKAKKREASSDRGRKDPVKPSAPMSDKSIHVKSEDVDIEMPDADSDLRTSPIPDPQSREKEDSKKKASEAEARAAEAKKKDDEAQKRRLEEDTKRRKEEEKRKKEEELKRKKEEELKRKEEEERRRKEERERKQKEEEERKRKEEERKRKEEEKKRREEEERRQKEEEEKKRRVEEEERKRKEAEERKKREEEERLRQEQLEREAAEEARRKREEEERKERERKEQERKEQERIRAEKEAEELRRQRLEEEERIRIAKLPALLRWLSTCSNPKSADIATRLRVFQGVRYDCINTSATGSPEGREQWLLNVQAALLLGDKDLDLSQFPTWRRLPVSMIAKKIIWRVEGDRYSMTRPNLYDIGKQLPGCYGANDPDTMRLPVVEQLRREAWAQFSNTSMFFVKVSDFMSVVPRFPHLHDVRLVVTYRELPEDESQLKTLAATQKWRNDPDVERFHGFAPRNKYYVNGQMVAEEEIHFTTASKTPFPEIRVPRRGLQAVDLDDPDFLRLCGEQGIDPMTIPQYRSRKLANGVAHSPKSPTGNQVNGRPHVNGDSAGTGHSASHPTAQESHSHANGINGTSSG